MNPRTTITADATNAVQSLSDVCTITDRLKRAESALIQVKDYNLKCGFVDIDSADYEIVKNNFIELESRDEISDFKFKNAATDETSKLTITLSFED